MAVRHCRCQEMDLTVRLMISKRPTNAPKKHDIQEVFYWLTKQLQYADEIDSLPSQTFILFKPQKRFKKKMENK